MGWKRIWAVLAVLCVVSVSAFGQANRLRDLVGARGGQAEGELERRGYVLTHSDRSNDSIYGYWWNREAKKCVVVRTNDGRYASIVDTTPFDCNQKVEEDEKNGLSTGAKVGIAAGAIAIIGALALAHKAHHHEDEAHYDDSKKEAEYERGYRDGLYSSSYHNYSNTQEYSRGYSAGVSKRKHETGYHSGRGGYRPHANVSDLRGVRASSGESEMKSRGFRNVDGFKSVNTSYTIWWNSQTRQCIQVATADGRYDSLVDIGNHPRCR